MKNLKIWQKLLLLAFVCTVPFLIVTWTLLSTVKEQVDFASGELTGVDYAMPLLALADDLRTHRALADRVIADQRARSADSSFDLHSKLVGDTAGLVAQVGDVSKLILDPQLDSYYLMITLLTEGPQLSEYLSQARLLAYPVPGGSSAERMERTRGLAALTAAADEQLRISVASSVSADNSMS